LFAFIVGFQLKRVQRYNILLNYQKKDFIYLEKIFKIENILLSLQPICDHKMRFMRHFLPHAKPWHRFCYIVLGSFESGVGLSRYFSDTKQ